jgi:putative phosphoesterase
VRELYAADLILHAGDFVAASVLAELRALGPRVEAVYGNNDDADLVSTLPERTTVEVEGTRIGLVHVGGPRSGREARLVGRFPDCGAVVYGHSHLPEVARFDGRWILNPGSPTTRRRAPFRSMLVVEVAGNRLEPRLLELP